MLNWFGEQIKHVMVKNPIIAMLFVVLSIVGLWGYYALAAEKADKAQVEKLSNDVSDLKGEMRGLARYLTGKDSFVQKPLTMPPQSYWEAGPDSLRRRAPWDSCFVTRICDSVSGRPPCVCYKGDSVDATFK